MSLDQNLTFIAPLRKINRIQIPKLIQEHFKLETTQTLRIAITIAESLGAKQTFLGKMRKDGCITVPPNTLIMLKEDRPTLESHILEVTIEPL
jgi:hypothetical protein